MAENISVKNEIRDHNARRILDVFKEFLLYHLEPRTCKVIARSFQSDQIFTQEEYVKVHHSQGHGTVEMFLDMLLEHDRDSKCYSTFNKKLEELGMKYIVEKLEGTNEENHFITEAWKLALDDNYVKLIKEFDPKPVLDVYGRKLVDDFDLKDIYAARSSHDMCYRFLYCLPKRKNWFLNFITALEDDICGDLSHWVDILDPEHNRQGAAFVEKMRICLNVFSEENFEPNDILNLMECIPESLRLVVSESSERKDRVKCFINLVTSRPIGWYKEFVTALKTYPEKYRKLLDLLEPVEAVKTEGIMQNQHLNDESEETTSFVAGGGPSQDAEKLSAIPDLAPSSHTACTSNDMSIMEKDRCFVDKGSYREIKVGAQEERCYASFKNEETTKVFVTERNSSSEDMGNEIQLSTPVQTPEVLTANENVEDNTQLNIPTEKHETEASEKSQRDVKDTSCTVEELELRDYQKELAKPALLGNNCMIVAPTGSGKTYVALKICLEHIDATDHPKVVFLVPRVPLVQQQFNLFKKFLGNEQNKIFQVTGESSSAVPVHISVEKHQVTIMTAQILVNLLRDEVMDISDITLLIIDECHHTVKNDPYNMIMRIYLDKRFDKPDPVKLPQIVGLTASPGMGKAKTMKNAHENIKTLMANLDVTIAPVKVNKTVSNLLEFQRTPQDDIITVPRRDDDGFGVKLKDAMLEIQRHIENDIKQFENVLEGRIVFDLRAAPGSQDYESWAVSLLNKSKLIKDETASQHFMAYAHHLHEYNNALLLNDHVRSLDAKEYITETLFNDEVKNRVEKRMKEIYERNEWEPDGRDGNNPLLGRLTLKMCQEFNRKSESRCIIFVKTRAIAKALLTCLNEDNDLKRYKLNPKQLTGAGARSDSFGMTKTGQEDTLKAFKDGSCKVLVATSVAEEGLDIKECNLIMTYNYSTNEVGQVQRKGRGRAKDSKVIMFAYEDSGHVKRERENAIRVELTEDILCKIQEMDSQKLEKQIRVIQEKLKKEREFERTVQEYRSKHKKPDDAVYRLSCIWCKRLATTSDNFRHINKQHRVVVDREFDKRARFKEVPEGNEGKQIGDEQFVIGKIYCKNKECGREWGLRMRYKSLPISVLRICNFVLTNTKGYRAVKKQWKDAPFAVTKELQVDDLRQILEDESSAGTSSGADQSEDDSTLADGLNLVD